VRKQILSYLMAGLLLFAGAAPLSYAQQINTFGNPSPLSRPGGVFYATAFNTYHARILSGNSSTGSGTSITVTAPPALADGTTIDIHNLWSNGPLVPISVNDANAEIVTPTSVSYATCPAGNLGVGGSPLCATITGTFNNVHGQSADVTSGTYGLQEAIDMAFLSGGGEVVVDGAWSQFGGTDTMLNAAVVYPNVSIRDGRKGAPQFWSPMSNTTVLATPVALTSQAACDTTHTFCSDATVAGSASWGGTVHGCITYVDIMGNESLCSTDASFTSVASKAIDIGSPAASTGAVGWKPYLSLSGGTYALAYSLPLLTQPTVLVALPVSSGVCTLTTLETTTPACALVNATYNQSSSTFGANTLFTGGAQFTTYPVVTNTLNPNLDSASAQSLNPNTGGHTVYKYVPSSHVGIPGVMTVSQSFPITTAAQSTIGQVAGSIALPPNFMNYVGRSIEVCGMLSKTSTNADTITNIQLWWDAEGSNVTTGQPIQLTNIQITQTNTAAATYAFCQDITTTVAAATATGGTITPGSGWMDTTQVSAGTLFAGAANSLFAAVGSLNLALNAHLDVVYNHTTGTDGAGVLLINPTVKILN
jgi:hypothetical protein